MPTPVGHTLVGYAFYEWGFSTARKVNYRTLILCVGCANFADLDFLPGLLMRQPNKFHGGVSHSLTIAFLLASLVALAIKPDSPISFWKRWVILVGIVGSHPILDCLAVDTGYPFGKPLFWPFSINYYQSPILLFSDVWRSPSSSDFFISLISWHNFMAVIREILVISPFLVLLKITRNCSVRGISPTETLKHRDGP